MRAALEGLAGIEAIRVDLAHDRFTVGYDPERVTPETMLETIEDLDFEPEIVGALDLQTAAERTGPIPEPVASAHAGAAREGKLLFLDFWAEWCAPCNVLERRTIADAQVQRFLSRHGFLRIDTDASPDAARYFDALGLPTVVVLSPAGEELFRHVGFIEASKLMAVLATLE